MISSSMQGDIFIQSLSLVICKTLRLVFIKKTPEALNGSCCSNITIIYRQFNLWIISLSLAYDLQFNYERLIQLLIIVAGISSSDLVGHYLSELPLIYRMFLELSSS